MPSSKRLEGANEVDEAAIWNFYRLLEHASSSMSPKLKLMAPEECFDSRRLVVEVGVTDEDYIGFWVIPRRAIEAEPGQ